jgi:hypothetical protein
MAIEASLGLELVESRYTALNAPSEQGVRIVLCQKCSVSNTGKSATGSRQRKHRPRLDQPETHALLDFSIS